MNKIIKGLGVAALALALPVFVGAATFTNVQFNNGDVTVSGNGGSTVNAEFRVVIPSGQVVEYIQTDVLGDNLAPVDVSVGGTLGLQEGTHEVTIPVVLPPNTGTYSLSVQGAGIYGGIRAISGNDNVVGNATFNNAIRVTADGNSNTGGSTNATPSWFTAWLNGPFAALLTQIGGGGSGSGNDTTECQDLTTKMIGAQYGVYNAQNVKLQGFLLSEGMSIPALSAGASFGFYGPQTAAAISAYKSANGCN